MEHKVLKRYPLGNKRFIWKQKKFALSTFSLCAHGTVIDQDHVPEIVDRSVKHLKEAGFNMGELGWVGHESAWEAVEACEKYGLDLIFQDMSILGGMQHHHIERKVPYEVVEDVVNRLKDKKHTIGYYVWDEPNTDEQMVEARRQMDMLQKAAPEALHFTVGLPDYNSSNMEKAHAWENGKYEPYVRKFAEKLDPPVLSFDYYPVGDYFGVWPGHKFNSENQLDDTFMWLDMALYRQVAKEKDIPFWFYYQDHRFAWHKVYYTYQFNMTRAMAHAGILHGAKALECYSEFNGFVDPTTGKPGMYFEDQKRLNSEMKALGNTLMALTCLRVIHDDMLLPDDPSMEGLRTTMEESELLDCALTPRISISEHTDAYGNKYLMVLNRDYEKDASFSLKLKNNSNVYVISKEDGEQYLAFDKAKAFPVHLAPGDLAIYRIQNADEEPFTIEYYLDK